MKYLYLIFLFSLFSCGQSINLNDLDVPSLEPSELVSIDAVAEKYSYSFTEKDCSTEQEASSLDEICSYLSDDELNNNCALDDRKFLYTKECTD